MSESHLSLQPDTEIVPGYWLVRPLGQGGFGEVWEARAPGDFPVALKFIRLDTSKARPEFRSLQILRAVRHPHLLDVQWVVEKADWLIIAMPLCDQSLHGRYLECLAQKLPGIPHQELLGYMTQVAEAVDFLNEPQHLAAHGKPFGVVHRDIKPHNIFLVGGAARLADFGLAKIIDESVAEHSGAMTPAYKPPEFFRKVVTPTSDQYSLAATYCLLRCGRLPFGGTIHEIIHGILNHEPDLSGLPSEERPAVAGALARDPTRRWRNCQEFVSRLVAGGAKAVVPRTNCLQTLAVEVRNKTLQILDVAKPAELMWTPPGTANHILWHAGHSLWVLDALCVRVMTGKPELPAGWEELFRMGSQPSLAGHVWPKKEELRRALADQLPKLLQLIGAASDSDLDGLPRFAHPKDTRPLGECILHGLHDEANHQGEMYLLLKAQRLNVGRR